MLKKILKYIIYPSLIYLVLFIILTFPLITFFTTDFFSDTGDGYFNVWSVWWVNYAISHLHQSPFLTDFVYYPFQSNLASHTLSLFNGLLSIPLIPLFGLVVSYNLIIIFEFVFAGVCAFLLCKTVTKSYFCSLVGGYIFTFSGFHFTHAQGHLNLISMGFMPLFILFWYQFLKKSSLVLVLGSSLSLTLLLISDYYYFIYCAGVGLVMLVFFIFQKQKINYFYLIVFGVLVLSLSSPILYYFFLLLSQNREFYPTHNPAFFSLDVLSLIIPGQKWAFSDLTAFYWQHLPSGNPAEKSLSLGLAQLFLAAYLFLKRKQSKIKDLKLWYIIAGIFLILSFGPFLQINGYSTPIFLPYLLLQNYLPFFNYFTVPIRMVVIVILCLSVISSYSLNFLLKSGYKKVVIFLLLILVIESWPASLAHSSSQVASYVYFLKELPKEGVMDLTIDSGTAEYYQTVHHKKLSINPYRLGEIFVSRIPQDMLNTNFEIYLAFLRNRFDKLNEEFGVNYLITRSGFAIQDPHLKLIYQDPERMIYELDY